MIQLAARLNHATDEAVRRDLDALPGLVERVQSLLDEGVIGGEQPNVADYQVATSMRLLQTLDDLRPLIDSHPAVAAHAERLVPRYPGHTPPVFPREWLPSRRFTREHAGATG